MGETSWMLAAEAQRARNWDAQQSIRAHNEALGALELLAINDKPSALWVVAQLVARTSEAPAVLDLATAVEELALGTGTWDDFAPTYTTAANAAHRAGRDAHALHAAWRLGEAVRLGLPSAAARKLVEAFMRASEAVPGGLTPALIALLAPAEPAPGDVAAVPEQLAVAWDRTLEAAPSPARSGSIVECVQRAERLGLDWACPVQRATAERAVPEALALLAV